IGHRVVHGGEQYRDSVRITPKTIATIQKLAELAPLHNPPNLKGILACKKLLKKAPQIAVFDTAFHETLPEKAFIYALPYELYTRHGIRRYGFHGTSHKYVSEQAAKILKKKNLKIVSCHLGNGSSVAAIMNGKSVDTSMGLTPLEGLPMGTRSGDIDPAIIFHLLKQHKKTPEQIETMLIKEAGLKGISGISSDVRILLSSVRKRNKRAELTFEVLCYRIAKYIGSYAAAMNGLDAIIFTAGIGEHAYYLRSDICKYLGFLGVKIDEQNNKKNALVVSAKTSTIKVLVIPTNEEEAIANETLRVLK
ncbi:MAG: acetate kinase, partial [Candidatus Gracilibacteria bacterium]